MYANFKLHISKDISKNDIIQLCDFLGSNGIVAEPEPITEGGIIYKEISEYKSMRLPLTIGGRIIFYWPRITENVLTEWRGNDDILLKKGSTMNAYIKGNTIIPEEIKVWISAFAIIGIVVKNKITIKS